MRPIAPLFWTVLASAVCGCAQSGIEVPVIGAVIDPSGALRPVQGVAGNFTIGPELLRGVLSTACSERLCLAKTDSKIVSAAWQVDAPAGPAIFGVEGDQAVVFFPDSGTFARWRDNTLEPLDWTADGEVLAIRLHGDETEIALRRDQDVWTVHPDGSVADWIAATPGPVLLLKEGVLFATPDELVLRHPDGSEMRFELPGAEALSAMGAHYAAIRAGGSIYALRTDSGREQLFLLPGNSP